MKTSLSVGNDRSTITEEESIELSKLQMVHSCFSVMAWQQDSILFWHLQVNIERMKTMVPLRAVYQGGMIFIAWTGHWTSHARHCMQSGSLAGSDFFSEVGCPGVSAQSNTFTGQTSMQTPSPSQISQSTATVVPCMPSLVGGSTGPQTS